jgi:hypothetical protein
LLTSAVIDSVGGLSNSASGSAATGSLTFSQQPADGDMLLLEANNTGTTITFKNVVTNAATQIQIGPTLGDTLVNAAAMLNASVDAHVATINYLAYPPSPGGAGEGSGAYQLLTAAATVGTASAARSASGSSTSFRRKPRTSAYPPIPEVSLRRTAWRPIRLTRNEARRMAAIFAKLPERCAGRRR